MSQDNTNTNNLNRTLQQSLQEVLMEVSLESGRLMGAPAAAPRNPLLHHNLGFSPFNMAGLGGGGRASRSASLSTSAVASNPYAAFLGGAGAAAAGSSSASAGGAAQMRPSEALGMSTEELLLAAATEKRMIEQSQRIAARQHALAEKTLESRRLYNESLLALMKSNSNSGGNNHGLLQQGRFPQFSKQQQPTAPSVNQMTLAGAVPPFQGGNNQSKVAIKVLGTSLRKKDSPYLDVSNLQDPDVSDKRTRGGVTEPFPEKLHRMLEEVQKSGKDDIISFFSHGRAFAVHDPDRFTAEIMPSYFKQSRLSSFQRQLNLYGFTRITSGPDAGGYYHELFLKARPTLAIQMRRVGLPKGEDRRKMRAKNMKSEPNFYAMGHVKDAQVNIPGIM